MKMQRTTITSLIFIWILANPVQYRKIMFYVNRMKRFTQSLQESVNKKVHRVYANRHAVFTKDQEFEKDVQYDFCVNRYTVETVSKKYYVQTIISTIYYLCELNIPTVHAHNESVFINSRRIKNLSQHIKTLEEYKKLSFTNKIKVAYLIDHLEKAIITHWKSPSCPLWYHSE